MHCLPLGLLLLPSFAPDRPGFADSTETVPRGRAQVELGARSSFEDDATLLRIRDLDR